MIRDLETGALSEGETLLDEFRHWSLQERGLAETSVRSYSLQAAKLFGVA